MSTSGPSPLDRASDPPTPTAAPKSERVCLNCRKKKKRCDKALPSCGRCTYSLEECQHEIPRVTDQVDLGGPDLDLLMSMCNPEALRYPLELNPEGFVLPVKGVIPASNPLIFAPQVDPKDIHLAVFRILLESLSTGNPLEIEDIVANHFDKVNIWFTILDRETLERMVADQWSNPSAETALLVLCMLLLTRMPGNSRGSTMQDGLYYTVKTTLALVEAGVPPSVPIVQAKVLIALHEVTQGMIDQAFLSVGSCVQMTRVFGWDQQAFWSDFRGEKPCLELRTCCSVWWGIVIVDCLVHISEPSKEYPLSTKTMDSFIPFPEHFRGTLRSKASPSFSGEEFGDESLEIWPESLAASYLSQVLQIGNKKMAPDAFEELSDGIMWHFLNVTSAPWDIGARCAATALNFIALLKLHRRYLADTEGTEVPSNSIETVASVINSIYLTSQLFNEKGPGRLLSILPTGAFSLFHASMLLLSYQETNLYDAEHITIVQSFRETLDILAQKWAIADKYAQYLDLALNAEMASPLNEPPQGQPT